MLRSIQESIQAYRYSYPNEYRARIASLKSFGEKEIDALIQELTTLPQTFVGHHNKMTLSDAIKLTRKEGNTVLEMKAPYLTFSKKTRAGQWDGNIDNINTITGTYRIFDGTNPTNLRMVKNYEGGPQIAPALEKTLGSGFRVMMRVDPYITPSSRFVIYIL